METAINEFDYRHRAHRAADRVSDCRDGQLVVRFEAGAFDAKEEDMAAALDVIVKTARAFG